jgi:hypothetical protein
MLKLTLVTLLLLSSCATETPVVKSLTKKSASKAKRVRRVSATPKDLITNFYEEYFESPRETEAPLSAGLSQLNLETTDLCQKKAPGEICTWASYGDQYLDAQDYSDNLSLKSSQLKVEPQRNNRVRVRFNIFPDLASRDKFQRELTYKVIKEKGLWVIDDIYYPNNRSARKTMLEIQKGLEDKSFSLPKMLSFTKAEKMQTNLKNLKRDKIFNAYKLGGKDLYLSLNAYPGPEKFNQLALSCDHCAVTETSLDQTLLCQSSFKSLYRQVVSKKNNDELSTLFKQARFEEGSRIPLPQPGHELRLEMSDLKCDGAGGKQMRIDVFLN